MSLGNAFCGFWPDPLDQMHYPMIVPFWADWDMEILDNWNSSGIYYNTYDSTTVNTETGSYILDLAKQDVQTYQQDVTEFEPTWVSVITWVNVLPWQSSTYFGKEVSQCTHKKTF